MSRVRGLCGRSLAEIACALDGDARASRIAGAGVRTKGKAGELVERALGATGGSAKVHDFVELGVELKTVPVDHRGRPRESTYVCTLPMDDIDRVEWETSWVRAKLARVLWVPLVGGDDAAQADRRIGEARLWSPTAEQEAILRADFEEAVGAIALGHVEALTARAGRWLQVRPKARDGAARTTAWSPDGEVIATVPRGFYLRAVFTGGILGDAAALP